MTWKIEKIEHRTYSRNPLVAVVAEIRFHPILSVNKGAKIPEFQDRVRAAFPSYAESVGRVVHVRNAPEVEIQEQKQFHFINEGEQKTATLSPSNLVLEHQRYVDRQAFATDMEVLSKALVDEFAPVLTRRIGMRYTNLIDLKQISSDLGRSLQWKDLVTKDFISLPAGVVDLKDTAFVTEINSPMADGGLILKYGLLKAPKSTDFSFRVDIDRYVETSFPVEEAPQKLVGFSNDVLSVFAKLVGPALKEWMEK